MRRRFSSYGFLLAFIAVAAYVLHPAHRLLGPSSSAETHCSVCHVVPAGVSMPPVVSRPTDVVAYDLVLLTPPCQFHLAFSLDHPRGPPAA